MSVNIPKHELLKQWNDVLWDAEEDTSKNIYLNRGKNTLQASSGQVWGAQKLTMGQIVRITSALMKDTCSELEKGFEKYTSDVAETVKEDFSEEMWAYGVDTENYQETVYTLKSLYQQRVVERYDAKWNEGLLGKIEWLVFHWFFDRSKEIDKIGNLIPKPETLFSTAEKILKTRIQKDIQKFNAEAPVPEAERVKLSEITPSVIKRSWLTRFAQDKFDLKHKVSEEAKSLRTGIIELTDYLSAMDALKTEWQNYDPDAKHEPIAEQEVVTEQKRLI